MSHTHYIIILSLLPQNVYFVVYKAKLLKTKLSLYTNKHKPTFIKNSLAKCISGGNLMWALV